MAGLILLAVKHVPAAVPPSPFWPSCDISLQHDLRDNNGASQSDPLLSHISLRVNAIQADAGTARKAGKLSESQTEMIWHHADRIRTDATRYAHEQGFLSAAERASSDRELDEVAGRLCARILQPVRG
ncbi:hypothetical protein HA45_20610 [Pantoea rodasii]|nr:hypothetical protein [Pantoea rodasii]ORM61546.1 hypothetical protein HA45_20610 [Pantoea rodasii]